MELNKCDDKDNDLFLDFEETYKSKEKEFIL